MQEALKQTTGGYQTTFLWHIEGDAYIAVHKNKLNPTHELLTPGSPTANVNLDKIEGKHFVWISNYVKHFFLQVSFIQVLPISLQ